MPHQNLKVLILGANGFIGNSLITAILEKTTWLVYGMDVSSNKIDHLLDHSRLIFREGDITINSEWLEYHIKKCDVVIPLVAIANPAQYVENPLAVFELNFEANLSIVRQCVKYRKRLIFPSTSEVYGMSGDGPLDESLSNFVYGPVYKQRWIYATSKQLLDRVIFAYGVHDSLDYTLFRPFNWIGPKLDDLTEPKEGSSRLFTQFISNVIYGRPIRLVDGGSQRRCFTYIDDGIECLLQIIENPNGASSRKIFNIGNPDNDVSVAELASLILSACKNYPEFRERACAAEIVIVSAEEYFGEYYQDIVSRVPSVSAVREALGWVPKTDLKTAIQRTLDYHCLYNSEDLRRSAH